MPQPETMTTAAGSDLSTFPIGEVSKLLGVSRETLRIWEREQLVSPHRTRGGHRQFSADDIARLRAIARLRIVEGLNAAAIRRELGSPPRDDSVRSGEPQIDLGARLRAIRSARGWSLAEVAGRAQLSISFLSAIERGVSSISVGNLFKLADAYGTTVPGLSADRTAGTRNVVHPGDRPRFVAGSGAVLIEDLIAAPGALEAQRIEIQPGGGSGDTYSHPGEEFIYVLSGLLVFLLEGRQLYRLSEGDSLVFRSERDHRWWNDGESPATVLWMNVPLAQEMLDTGNSRVSAGRRGDSTATVRRARKGRGAPVSPKGDRANLLKEQDCE
jgi:DNA-binding transcriptional MerR regulator/quercetin dioxygenase-like cupin family protein